MFYTYNQSGAGPGFFHRGVWWDKVPERRRRHLGEDKKGGLGENFESEVL